MSKDVEQEEQPSEDVTLPIEWRVSETIHNQYVHNMIVQPGPNEITFFLFDTHLPPYVGSPEANRDSLLNQSVRFECVGKFVVSPKFVPDMIQALQTGLDNYNIVNSHEEGKQRDER